MTYKFFEYMEFWQMFITVLVIALAAGAAMHGVCCWLKAHTRYRWVRFLVRRDILDKWEREAK
jgi:ABC-type uncharacterized transport system permease subunit